MTTNPSLLAKESGDYRKILQQICHVVKGPVSAEVVATDTAGMLREGRDLAGIDEHIVVKVPFTKDVRELYDYMVNGDAGVARCQGGRKLREPVRGSTR